MDVEREERREGAESLTWCTMGFFKSIPSFNPIREGKSAATGSGLDLEARSIVTTVEIVEKHKNSPSEILFLGRRAEDHRGVRRSMTSRRGLGVRDTAAASLLSRSAAASRLITPLDATRVIPSLFLSALIFHNAFLCLQLPSPWKA